MTAATAVPEYASDLFADVDSTINTTTTSSDPSPDDILMEAWMGRKPSSPMRVFTLSPRDEEVLGIKCEKSFWHEPQERQRIAKFTGCVFEFHSDVGELGYPGDAAISWPLQALITIETEPETETWRGVFAYRHAERELFSQTVDLMISSLPRWRPQITLTRRMLEDDE